MVHPVHSFVWVIFPVFGMAMGAFAIWNEFSRQKKALDVLRVYAERGTEPPESVLALLDRASSSRPGRRAGGPWSQFAFFAVLAAGFGALDLWMLWAGRGGPFIMGFAVITIALTALAVSALVQALGGPRANGP